MELLGALFGVIGVGWLTLVPSYRGWGNVNQQMAERIEITVTALGHLNG